ncbi:Uncharacterized protein Rs2_45947 [Raphanus sativus]|nr:Uncharacterized protein Rs2_45947 [Raphanus sativus]
MGMSIDLRDYFCTLYEAYLYYSPLLLVTMMVWQRGSELCVFSQASVTARKSFVLAVVEKVLMGKRKLLCSVNWGHLSDRSQVAVKRLNKAGKLVSGKVERLSATTKCGITERVYLCSLAMDVMIQMLSVSSDTMWSCPFQVKPTMLCSLYVALSGVTTPSGLKILDITAATSSTNGVTNIVYREIFNDLGTARICEQFT